MNRIEELKKLKEQARKLKKEIETIEKELDMKNDPIFLLSSKEYNRYKDKIPHINCWWWLCSSGSTAGSAAVINYEGVVINGGFGVFNDYGAIRPALRISNLKPFEAIKVDENHIFCCGITWIKIDEDLYIAEVPISFRRFDKENEDYTTSEIRQLLLNWYEARKKW